jgi:hypothetical protein
MVSYVSATSSKHFVPHNVPVLGDDHEQPAHNLLRDGVPDSRMKSCEKIEGDVQLIPEVRLRALYELHAVAMDDATHLRCEDSA